jgi:hypothetical protein
MASIVDDKMIAEFGRIFLEQYKLVIAEQYNLFASKAVYSIFLKIINGTDTYQKLVETTGKKRSQLVHIISPILKTEIVKVKDGTGVSGHPAQFYVNMKRLEEMLLGYIEHQKFVDNLQQVIKKHEKAYNKLLFDFIVKENLLFVARSFSELAVNVSNYYAGIYQNTKTLNVV